MMHEKIGPHHLERKAILYVRQSSAHQVLHNRESSALQYAMRDRLKAFGWSQIETVDEDGAPWESLQYYPLRDFWRDGKRMISA
jgi:predicted site-specific integrase-resolvase